MSAAAERVTVEPGKRGGKPCVRGLRITVWDILGWLRAGMTEAQVLDEHPDPERDDFSAVYQFAAEIGRRALAGEPAPGRKPVSTSAPSAFIAVSGWSRRGTPI